MSGDALFQLGMGSVLLNASQEEETLGMSAMSASAEAICVGKQDRSGPLAHAAANPFCIGVSSSSAAAIRRLGLADLPSKPQ